MSRNHYEDSLDMFENQFGRARYNREQTKDICSRNHQNNEHSVAANPTKEAKREARERILNALRFLWQQQKTHPVQKALIQTRDINSTSKCVNEEKGICTFSDNTDSTNENHPTRTGDTSGSYHSQIR